MLFKNINNNVFKLVTENFDYQDQTFSDPDGTYSVKNMVDYVNTTKNVVDFPIEKLLHNLEPSEHETGDELPGHPDFIKRADAASLQYPIIAVKYSDGYWIADGVHRLYKANSLGHKTIKAHVLDQSELINFKL